MEIINKIKDEFMKSPIFNTLLILVIIYLISKNTIEKFTATSAPSTTTPSAPSTTTPSGISQDNLKAIDNLNKIASQMLDSSGNLNIKGNLSVNGRLTVDNTTQLNNNVTIGKPTAGKLLTVFAKNGYLDKNHKITLGNHGSNIILQTHGLSDGEGKGEVRIATRLGWATHFNHSTGNNFIRGTETKFHSVMDDRKKIVINTTDHRNMIKLYHTGDDTKTEKGGKIGASDYGELLINGFTDDKITNESGEVKINGKRVAKQGDQISLTNWPGGCGVVSHGYGCDGKNFDRQIIQ